MHELLKVNLLKCFKLYTKNNVEILKDKYKSLVKKASLSQNLIQKNGSQFPDQREWEDIIFHGFNLNIL